VTNLDPRQADLEQIQSLAWAMLVEGAARGRVPFHTPVLATRGPEGPAARTVVLRAADPATRTVLCHTDQRSPKVAVLDRYPEAAWVFYDSKAKIQLRLRGRVSLHHADELAAQRWTASRNASRACYRNTRAPGTRVSAPESVQADPDADGYANFTVVRCEVAEMDWLYLHAAGHRRARFEWRSGRWAGHWVAP
jgi:hypothetical protein